MVHSNSIQAWNEIQNKISGDRLLFYKYYIAHGPMTDRQIHEAFPNVEQYRPRITELVDDGLLIETGTTKDHITGRLCRTCRAVTMYEFLNKKKQLELAI